MEYLVPSAVQRAVPSLSAPGATGFALACAERLLPTYHRYCQEYGGGRWEVIRHQADELWIQLHQGIIAPDDSFVSSYSSLAPSDDIPKASRTPLDALAENAVLALGAAWECYRDADSGKALWSSQQGYEAADYLAQNLSGIDFRDPAGERDLISSEFVQRELAAQWNDILQLECLHEGDGIPTEVLHNLHRVAAAHAIASDYDLDRLVKR
jgi:Protein of unknown function (DUF416)